MATLAFDIYGTLINPVGIAQFLTPLAGKKSPAVAARLREKQLEYTFRRALMRQYTGFTECTQAALNYICEEQNLPLSPELQNQIMAAYGKLPAFSQAAPCLEKLRNQHRLYAFSNGEHATVQAVLRHNGLLDFFADIVSVEEVQSFKPDPKVYAHFLRRTAAAAADTWLISGNPFDIIGAAAGGWRTAWIKQQTFDPWEHRPTVVVNSLAELPASLK